MSANGYLVDRLDEEKKKNTELRTALAAAEQRAERAEAERNTLKGDKKAIGAKLHNAKRRAEKAEVREKSAKKKVAELNKENQKLRDRLKAHWTPRKEGGR